MGYNTPGTGATPGGGSAFGGAGSKTSGGTAFGGQGKRPKTKFVPASPITEAQKAINLSRQQRKLQGPGLNVAQTILGAMPSPALGLTFGFGRYMGKKAEDVLQNNPASAKVIPGDPSGVYGNVGGMNYSNRAEFPGHSLTKDNINAKNDPLKKLKQVQTVLGGAKGTLGTTKNPMPI